MLRWRGHSRCGSNCFWKKIMAFVSHVTIEQLNGYSDLSFPLKGRHCIFVGPNGTGKSTALQIIAYALGRQWKSLGASRFEKLHLQFSDGKRASISRDACRNFSRSAGANTRYARIGRDLTVLNIFDDFLEADFTSSEARKNYSQYLNMPEAEIRNAQQYFRRTSTDKSSQKEISSFQDTLKATSTPLSFYLPTYRRIELELEKMFTNIPDYMRQDFRARAVFGTTSEFLIELVKFGMEDVSSTIQAFERQTRDFARNRFNRMMTSYLKEMANSKVISVGDLRSRHIDEKTIEIVLSRIEEGLLSQAEKSQISSIILDLSSGPGAGNQPFNKKWLAHFFVRLLEVNGDIEKREHQIRSFVDVLDKYFFPKRVTYDIENYHFAILGENEKEIPLSDLSSGEKQVVSILSQFYLSEDRITNVFIDEPELSLSVPWQSDLLPDIAKTPSCGQIFAVTHSPFIYENNLADYAIDFLEFRQGR